MMYAREEDVRFIPGPGNNRWSNIMALGYRPYHLSSWYRSLLERHWNLVLWAWVKFAFPVRVVNSRTTNEVKGVAKGGSWGARDPPFCTPFLSKQPTTGGENAMTM